MIGPWKKIDVAEARIQLGIDDPAFQPLWAAITDPATGLISVDAAGKVKEGDVKRLKGADFDLIKAAVSATPPTMTPAEAVAGLRLDKLSISMSRLTFATAAMATAALLVAVGAFLFTGGGKTGDGGVDSTAAVLQLQDAVGKIVDWAPKVNSRLADIEQNSATKVEVDEKAKVTLIEANKYTDEKVAGLDKTVKDGFARLEKMLGQRQSPPAGSQSNFDGREMGRGDAGTDDGADDGAEADNTPREPDPKPKERKASGSKSTARDQTPVASGDCQLAQDLAVEFDSTAGLVLADHARINAHDEEIAALQACSRPTGGVVTKSVRRAVQPESPKESDKDLEALLRAFRNEHLGPAQVSLVKLRMRWGKLHGENATTTDEFLADLMARARSDRYATIGFDRNVLASWLEGIYKTSVN